MYLKNVAAAIGKSFKESLEYKVQGLSDITSFVTEIKGEMGTGDSSRKFSIKKFIRDDFGKELGMFSKNLKQQIKTGKWEDATGGLGGMSAFMDGDEAAELQELLSGSDGLDGLSESDVAGALEGGSGNNIEDVTAGDSLVAESVIGSSAMQTNAITEGAKTTAKAVDRNAMINYGMLNQIAARLDAHHRDASQFYGASLQGMADLLEKVDTLATIAEKNATISAINGSQENNFLKSDINRVFGSYGSLDGQGYVNLVKQRLREGQLGMLGMGISTAGKMGAADLKNNPLGFAISQGFNFALEKTQIGRKITEMGESFESMAKSLPMIIGRLQNSNNDVLQWIGRTFGVTAQRSNLNRGSYEKGPVPFDGVTKKSIVEVIPSYLSKILNTLEGGGKDSRQVFDFERGEFSTVGKANERFQREFGFGGFSLADTIASAFDDIAPEDLDKVKQSISNQLFEGFSQEGGLLKGQKFEGEYGDILTKVFADANVDFLRDANQRMLQEVSMVNDRRRNIYQDQFTMFREIADDVDNIENAGVSLGDMTDDQLSRMMSISEFSSQNRGTNKYLDPVIGFMNDLAFSKSGKDIEKELGRGASNLKGKLSSTLNVNRNSVPSPLTQFGNIPSVTGGDGPMIANTLGQDIVGNALNPKKEETLNETILKAATGSDDVDEAKTKVGKLIGGKDYDKPDFGMSKLKQFKGAGIGAGVGMLTMGFLPGGPLMGALLGGLIGNKIAKNPEEFKAKMKDRMGRLIVGKDWNDPEKSNENTKKLMGIGKSAGVGLLASMFLPGGPITGALLGAGVGRIAQTEFGKKLLFGKEDPDTHERNGGLIGTLKGSINSILFGKDKDKQGGVVGFFKKYASDFGDIISKPFRQQSFTAFKETFLMGMDSVKNFVTEKIFGKDDKKTVIGKIFGTVFDKMKKMSSFLGKLVTKGVGGILRLPLKMLGMAGGGFNKIADRLKVRHLKAGKGAYVSEAERQRLSEEYNDGKPWGQQKGNARQDASKRIRDNLDSKKGGNAALSNATPEVKNLKAADTQMEAATKIERAADKMEKVLGGGNPDLDMVSKGGSIGVSKKAQDAKKEKTIEKRKQKKRDKNTESIAENTGRSARGIKNLGTGFMALLSMLPGMIGAATSGIGGGIASIMGAVGLGGLAKKMGLSKKGADVAGDAAKSAGKKGFFRNMFSKLKGVKGGKLGKIAGLASLLGGGLFFMSDRKEVDGAVVNDAVPGQSNDLLDSLASVGGQGAISGDPSGETRLMTGSQDSVQGINALDIADYGLTGATLVAGQFAGHAKELKGLQYADKSKGVANAVSRHFGQLGGKAKELGQVSKSAGMAAFNVAKKSPEAFLAGIKSSGTTIVKMGKSFLKSPFKFLKKFFMKFFRVIVKGFKFIKPILKKIPGLSLLETLSELFMGLSTAQKSSKAGTKKRLELVLKAFIQSLPILVFDLVKLVTWIAAAATAGAATPLAVVLQLLIDFALLQGVKWLLAKVAGWAAPRIADFIYETLGLEDGEESGGVKGIFNKISDSFKETMSETASFWKEKAGNAFDFAKDMFSDTVDVGRKTVDSIMEKTGLVSGYAKQGANFLSRAFGGSDVFKYANVKDTSGGIDPSDPRYDDYKRVSRSSASALKSGKYIVDGVPIIVGYGQTVNLAGTNAGTWAKFKAAALEYHQQTGRTIQINSGMRTNDEQMALWKSDPEKAAMPGISNHEFALDIQTSDADKMAELGILQKHGLHRPYIKRSKRTGELIETWHVQDADYTANKSSYLKDNIVNNNANWIASNLDDRSKKTIANRYGIDFNLLDKGNSGYKPSSSVVETVGLANSEEQTGDGPTLATSDYEVMKQVGEGATLGGGLSNYDTKKIIDLLTAIAENTQVSKEVLEGTTHAVFSDEQLKRLEMSIKNGGSATTVASSDDNRAQALYGSREKKSSIRMKAEKVAKL